MLENYNLKSVNEELKKFDINDVDVNENDETQLTEVYRKGDLVLYEYDNDDIGPSVSIDVIEEIFPTFKINPMKYYLLEKNGEIYFE